ncbi:hypothetical protein BDV93DRAFT_97492 [Ceratobasidium sp. AG-I]|nr:hypothetical protein BDV93DRAFT_97492 [Ceratobasidium sp. AG-I]
MAEFDADDDLYNDEEIENDSQAAPQQPQPNADNPDMEPQPQPTPAPPTLGSPTPGPDDDPEEFEEPIRRMNARCGPCIQRGQYSRCNKTWPSCSRCEADGTTMYCFQGADILADNIARQAARDMFARPPPSNASRRTPGPPSNAGRRTPVPPATPQSRPQSPPAVSRRSGSPGRGERPMRDARPRTPPPRPSPSPSMPGAYDRVREDRMRALRLQLARAQAELAQAELDMELAPGVAPPVMLPRIPANPALGDLILPPMNTGGPTAPRVRPPVVPGLVLNAAYSSVPDVLWKLLGTAGWVTHVPLTYFVDDFIDNTDEHTRLEESYHMSSQGRWVRTGGDQLPDRNELGIQTVQWIWTVGAHTCNSSWASQL